MNFHKIAILLTVLGKAMSDSNKGELCSKKYFNRINGSIGDGNGIQLIREQGDSYHSWDATLEFNNNSNFYSLSQISYNLSGWSDLSFDSHSISNVL